MFYWVQQWELTLANEQPHIVAACTSTNAVTIIAVDYYCNFIFIIFSSFLRNNDLKFITVFTDFQITCYKQNLR